MMRRLAPVVALVLLAAACHIRALPVEESPDDCGRIAADVVELLQDQLDALATSTVSELRGPQLPAGLAELTDRSRELTARADEIGCDRAEVIAAVSGSVTDLEAEGPLAQLYLETVLDALSDSGAP